MLHKEWTCNSEEKACNAFVKSRKYQITGICIALFYLKNYRMHQPTTLTIGMSWNTKRYCFLPAIIWKNWGTKKTKITVTGSISSSGFIFLVYSWILKDFYAHTLNTSCWRNKHNKKVFKARTITYTKESSYHSWYITSKTMHEASADVIGVGWSSFLRIRSRRRKEKVLHLVNFSSLNEY